MLLGNQWFRKKKKPAEKGNRWGEWEAYPGSCATSSQISMSFAQSISLSLSLVAAFTISAAIFSARVLHSITRLLSLSSKSRPVIHSKGREEIPASCNEAIASVKIALLSINRSPRARKEPFCPSRKNKKKREMQSGATRSHRREQRAREAVARTNLDRPQVHSRRAASGFWLATAVARPWRRRHAQ